jgi:hypothetical protein
MSVMRQLLDNLSDEDREALMVAFNDEETFLVSLANDHFIGVHIEDTTDIVIKERAGYWIYGKFSHPIP